MRSGRRRFQSSGFGTPWSAPASHCCFPWSSQPGGPSGTFLAYGLLAAAGLLFIVILAPETKGKTLEELEGILTQPKQVMGS